MQDPIIDLSDDDSVITITEGEAAPARPSSLTRLGGMAGFFRGIMAGAATAAAVAVAIYWTYLDHDARPAVESPAPFDPAPEPAPEPAAAAPAPPPGASAPVLTDPYDDGPAAGTDRAAREAVDQARTHLALGIELYNERDFDGAVVELKRAYDLAPRHEVLYDLAQVALQQQDYLTAWRNLRRYLIDGGDAVPAGRRFEIEAEIERLEQRIGRLVVQAPPRTRILIDGREVGVVPLGSAIRANVGRRRLQAVSPTGDRWETTIELVGGDAVTVTFGPLRSRRPPAVRSDDEATSGEPISEDAPMPPGSANVRGPSRSASR
ncbi:MAG TPA: hypothetical protein VMU50_00185 [Polyangia bacterium]|nr:hypothetical protein [Polyangia bacterium]